MPQMSPLSWLMLFMFFSVIYMSLIFDTYFFYVSRISELLIKKTDLALLVFLLKL